MKNIFFAFQFLLYIFFFSCQGHKSSVSTENEKAAKLQASMIWLDSARPGKQAYVVFRKKLNIEHTPISADLRIFADTRYRLWINGKYVERGPCRFDPKHPEYDILQVGSYLEKGDNAIAILVHHYAIESFSQWYDKCARMMHHDPGLTAMLTVFSWDNKAVSFFTDTSWKASMNTRFRNSPGSYSSVPDNIDARIDEGDWTLPSFDDSGWQNVSFIDGNGWGTLNPRSIPLLKEKDIMLKAVCQEKNGTQPVFFQSLSDMFPLKMKSGQKLVLDAGKAVQAYPVLDFEAEESTELEISFASLFYQNNNKPFQASFTGEKIKSRYIAKKGFQRYMGGDTYGFRYMIISILNGELTLTGVRVVDRKYPNERPGYFSCNDTLLNNLWDVCVNTVEVCSEDAYVDCADRERAQWMADGYKMNYPVTGVALATKTREGGYQYRDSRLLQNMLRQMALSQLPDGRLQPMRPSDYNAGDTHGVIDDYSCLWIQALREYSDRTGNNAFLEEMWPYAVKAMDYFLARTTKNGLINAGEFVYFDNPLRYVKCEGATINAFIYGALMDMAHLSGTLGKRKERKRFQRAGERLYTCYNEKLWDPVRVNYYAAIINEEPAYMRDDPASYSEPYKGDLIDDTLAPPNPHAALLALYFKLVPGENRQKVFDFMLSCSDMKQVWWPYTSRYFLDLLYRENDPQLDMRALNYIRQSFGHMADYETGTTSEDWKGGSFMHESGSHPAYFLSAYVLGVRTETTAKGLQLIIQPRLGDLEKALGNVLCEFGEVPVKWERSANGNVSFHFSIPPNSCASVYLPLLSHKIPSEIIINGEYHIQNSQISGTGEWNGNYYLFHPCQGPYSGEIIYK